MRKYIKIKLVFGKTTYQLISINNRLNEITIFQGSIQVHREGLVKGKISKNII